MNDPFDALPPATAAPQAGAAQVASDPFDSLPNANPTPNVPRGTSKPFLGIDLSGMAPAKTMEGAAAEGALGTVTGAYNMVPSMFGGLKNAVVSPAAPGDSWWERTKNRWKGGLQQAAQGAMDLGQVMTPGALEANPDGSQPNPLENAKKAGTGALNLAGGIFEALGLNQAQREAGQMNSAMAPPVAQTRDIWLNAASALPSKVLWPTLTEVATDPTLAYGIGRAGLNVGKGLAGVGKDFAGSFKAPEVDVEGLKNLLSSTPDSGVAAEIRAKTTGQTGVNAALPETYVDMQNAAADAAKPQGMPATDWEMKHAAEGRTDMFPEGEQVPGARKPKPPVEVDPRPAEEVIAEKASKTPEQLDLDAKTQLDKDVQAAKAVSKQGVPKQSELAVEKVAADRQSMLDDMAEMSNQTQKLAGVDQYPDHVSLVDWVNPQTSAVIRPMAEKLNRAFESIVEELPKYMQTRDAVVDLLKKPGRFGRYVRDYDAEQQVAKALDGVLTREQLNPAQQQAYDLSRQVLDKVSRLEGLDLEGKTLKDYWWHTLGKDHPLVKSLAGKGTLYDPFSGALVNPSTPAFKMARAGQDLNWNYNLGDVLGMRLNIGVRKAILDPIINDLKVEASTLPNDVKDYANNVLDRVQGRPGIPEIIMDKAIKGLTDTAAGAVGGFNNKVSQNLAAWLRSKGVPGAARRAQAMVARAYYRWYLGFAVDTAMKNAFQSVNTPAVSGIGNTIKGGINMAKYMLSAEGRELVGKAGIDMELMMNHQLDNPAIHTAMKNWDKLGFSPMQFTEYLNRGLAHQAGLLEATEKFAEAGIKNPPMWALDRYARTRVDLSQFKYGPANINPYLNNPLGKLYYQFATYPFGQLNLMRQMFRDVQAGRDVSVGVGKFKLPNKLVKLFVIQGMVGVGLKRSLDIDVMDSMGWGDHLFGHKLPFSVPGLGTVSDVMGRLPGGQNIVSGQKDLQSPAMQLGGRSDEQTASLKALLLGGMGVPGRYGKKVLSAQDEMHTGEAKNAKGDVVYPISQREALWKNLGFKPKVQQDYNERAEAYYSRRQ